MTLQNDLESLNLESNKAAETSNPISKASSNQSKSRSNREAASPSVKLSKALSYLLRHGAEKEKLKIRQDGFVKIDDILKSNRVKGIEMPLPKDQGQVDQSDSKKSKKNSRSPNIDDILEVVNENEKKRFEILEQEEKHEESETGDGNQTKGKGKSTSKSSNLWIRAVQGHSLAQVSALSHTPLTLESLSLLNSKGSSSPTVIHGTSLQSWELIRKSKGLSTMKRNHIHLARGLPEGFKFNLESFNPDIQIDPSTQSTKEDKRLKAVLQEEGEGDGKQKDEDQDKIISGMRLNSQVLIFIDIQKAIEDGIEFFLSQNGVVLTPGITKQEGDRSEEVGKAEQKREGILSMKYFEKVLSRSGEVIWKPEGEQEKLV